ncbi:2OG-Fe(II) oxygenase [Kitasatospora xanthocidica]|uniref:2OG-Fe(II) oxygenase n=1 Tax=Kitasatospora xanthocidica TaxID=83382 RepID=UPI0036ECDCFA
MFDTESGFARIETPYQIYLAQQTLPRSEVAELYSTVPLERAASISRDDPKHEKQYRMNLFYLMLNNRRTAVADELPPAWASLLSDLTSSRFTDWLSAGTGVKLDGLFLDVGVYTHREGDYLSPHKDKTDKAITALLYLNEDWPTDGGGEFEVRASGRSAERPVLSLPPRPGQFLAFVPTDRSWHSVSRVASGNPVTRLTVQVEYWFERIDRYRAEMSTK